MCGWMSFAAVNGSHPQIPARLQALLRQEAEAFSHLLKLSLSGLRKAGSEWAAPLF